MNPLRASRALLLIATGSLAASVHGQGRLLAPLNAAAPVPPLAYQSWMTDYRPNLDSEPLDWRSVNDMVGRGAGHAGHSMGPATPAKPYAAAPAQPPQARTEHAAHQHKHKE